MADVAFYHLTRSRADDALPPLLAKTLAAEKKALVCCRKDNFSRLSMAIWSRQLDSWLPHGIAGQHDSDASLCPIWLAESAQENSNKADFLFFLDGRVPDELPSAERVFILFDGTDEAATAAARGQWKALHSGGGHDLSYWRQDDNGKWSRAR